MKEIKFRPEINYLDLNSARFILEVLERKGPSSWYPIVISVDRRSESEKTPPSFEVLHFLVHQGYVSEEAVPSEKQNPNYSITDKGKTLLDELKSKSSG